MITIQIDEDNLRETLIALRDRRFTLQQSLGHEQEIVRDISARQLKRVIDAGQALAAALNEAF